MSNNKNEKYFVEENKSVRPPLVSNVILTAHKEIKPETVHEDAVKAKGHLDILCKRGVAYKAVEPRQNAAEEKKRGKAKAIKEEATAKIQLKAADDKIKDLEGKLKNASDKETLVKLNSAKEALETEKTSHGETKTKLDSAEESLGEEVTAHSETKAKFADGEKALEDEMTAHEATKKELKELKEKAK